MIWNGIKIEDNLLFVRKYFETYMEENNYDVDTRMCDTLMLTMYEMAPWDGDYDTFYDFMVENLV